MLHQAALADASAGKEQSIDRHFVQPLGLSRRSIVEAVYFRSHFLALPSVTAIGAVVAPHFLGIAQVEGVGAAVGIHAHCAAAIAHSARSAHQQHASTLAVAHHGSVAVAHVEAFVALAFSHHLHGRLPSLAAVGAASRHDADVAHRADVAPSGGVGHARAVVGEVD